MAAVLRELKSLDSEVEIKFWCDRKFAPQARRIISNVDSDIPVETILAGKLRRYHGLSKIRQLTYPPIVLRNIGDMFLVSLGFLQSVIKLVLWRPDVVFTKGGFVCLPIGLAARLLRIPLVIHDSDAHPGLTNRILARFASAIATGAPLKFYQYPKDRSKYVGIPIASDFRPFSAEQQRSAKLEIGVNQEKPLVVITGGGLGAQRINELVLQNLDYLLGEASVILISGAGQYDSLVGRVPTDNPNFQLHAFVSKGMATMLGAADVVVARAGATTILELAALEKAIILIPNALLTGGHQLKNAAVYADKDAVLVLDESQLVKNPSLFGKEVLDLIHDEPRRRSMESAFGEFARPRAAKDVAEMILAAKK